MRTFGAVAYCRDKRHLGKLDLRCQKGVLVGYINVGYKIWNPYLRRCFYTREVIINESRGVYQKSFGTEKEDISNIFEDLLKERNKIRENKTVEERIDIETRRDRSNDRIFDKNFKNKNFDLKRNKNKSTTTQWEIINVERDSERRGVRQMIKIKWL